MKMRNVENSFISRRYVTRMDVSMSDSEYCLRTVVARNLHAPQYIGSSKNFYCHRQYLATQHINMLQTVLLL
jgi:hypothetical protein